ncbi:glycosyltransferase family 4 protein [Xylanimonas protaetiae]|uniref:Glycosyltransferase n=1 Tax=Xylanimonas protaetiae TaxID=2509457 RepID=A0A4P6F3Z2_9MICO|nr:glycosyltransferase family 4 protein [Xylanimonas protaetiae]QAY68919.1 glycosyltransferase [Xylanimonas protaetiae]
MKILLVTPWFPTTVAPESGLFVLRDALALAMVADVSVLHLDWNSDTTSLAGIDPAIRVQRVRLDRRDPRAYLRARKHVRAAARQADVVHTHALTGLVPFLVGRPAPARSPWVHTEHWSGLTASETLGRAERVMRRLLLPVLRRPDVVVVACRRLAEPIGALRRGRVEVVPCVVDDPPQVREATRDPHLLRLVGVGGLIDRKGPLTALATVAELRRRGMPAQLTWVGTGPLREAVLDAAKEAGLEEDVHLAGALPPAEVAAELDAADMFILPTSGDNFCVVVAEALTHGRPVVSGASTGAVDYAVAAVSEFVESRDAFAYADAVVSLRERTARMSAADIAGTVRGAFSSEAVAHRLMAVYGQLVHP